MLDLTGLDESTIELLKKTAFADRSELIGSTLPHSFSHKDGFYAVHLNQNSERLWATSFDMKKYHWLGINSYRRKDKDDDSSGRYVGIDDSGIALVVIDMSKPLKNGKDIDLRPTVICKYNAIVHYIYRLKKYFPVTKSKPEARWKFDNCIKTLEKKSGGNYVFINPILNPYCDDVEILYHNKDSRFDFNDFRHVRKIDSEEEQERKRNEKKEKLDTHCRNVSLKRKETSLKIICKTIIEMKKKGERVNQVQVAKQSGLGRRTIIRHWKHDEVERLL